MSLLIAGRPLVGQARDQTATYTVSGVVRDSSTGMPLANVFIWPGLRRYGVVSDSLGRFAFHWRAGLAHVVRIGRCERELAQLELPWLADSLTNQDLRVPARAQRSCAESMRAPWDVTGADTTTLVGIYTYSWEGGGWIERCGGKMYYRPDWDAPAWQAALRGKIDHEGAKLFVRLRGRVAHDGFGEFFPGSLFLTSLVEEVRVPREDDCR